MFELTFILGAYYDCYASLTSSTSYVCEVPGPEESHYVHLEAPSNFMFTAQDEVIWIDDINGEPAGALYIPTSNGSGQRSATITWGTDTPYNAINKR